MTLGESNDRIDKSMDDSKNKKLISASDLKAKMDKWNQVFFGLNLAYKSLLFGKTLYNKKHKFNDSFCTFV